TRYRIQAVPTDEQRWSRCYFDEDDYRRPILETIATGESARYHRYARSIRRHHPRLTVLRRHFHLVHPRRRRRWLSYPPLRGFRPPPQHRCDDLGIPQRIQ